MKCERAGKSCNLWWLNRLMRIGCLLLVLPCFAGHSFTLALDNSTSTFIERCYMDCNLQKDFMSCGKYRVARWLHDVKEKEFSYGPVRLIRIPSMPYRSVLPKLPQSRVFKSSAIETLNFVRDIVEDLLTKRALVYTVDNISTSRSFGSMPMILDDDEFTELKNKKESEGNFRIFKKKKSLILPILILLNLLKLKLLLLPIFLGVHFIKKLLVLASLIAPSILAHLKICKVPPHHQQPYHMWGTAAEAPPDYPTGYGQEEPWIHRNDLAYQGYYRNPYG
ncbi:uncharacterized protein LOC143183411 [Calliopsis andreniformis]|uniref:uncharacterized protein LOC143183411 n=1 Tax=Calliopsis andreniformis TaxID=337506 RepID=UPI003FCE5890